MCHRGSLEKVVVAINILRGQYCMLGYCPRKCDFICRDDDPCKTSRRLRWSLVNQLKAIWIWFRQPGFANVKKEARVNFVWGQDPIEVKEGNWPVAFHKMIPPPLHMDFLNSIHKCVGGELYHQDILCFKDGNLITNIYEARSKICVLSSSRRYVQEFMKNC